MTTITINQYNNIKKEAINKYMDEVWVSTGYNTDIGYMLESVRRDIFDKLDKRQERNKRKGVTMITLTTHGEIEC